jgi:tetratricopeptide (TPR) repeat protein
MTRQASTQSPSPSGGGSGWGRVARVPRLGHGPATCSLHTPSPWPPPRGRRNLRFGGVALLLPLVLAFTTTGGLVKEGNRALDEGDAKEAMEAYEKALQRAPGSPEILFDTGLARAAAGDPGGAREAFLAALAGGGEGLRGAIEYNVGNTYFAEADYGSAVKAYRAALVADPSDQDAKANLELTLRRIAEQQEQQQQQDQQQQEGQQGEQPPQPDQAQSDDQDQQQGDQDQGDSQQPPVAENAGEPQPEQPPHANDQGENQEQARDRQRQDQTGGSEQQAEPTPQRESPQDDTGGAGQEATAAAQMDPQQVGQLLDALQSQEEQLQQQVRARLVPVAPQQLEQDW